MWQDFLRQRADNLRSLSNWVGGEVLFRRSLRRIQFKAVIEKIHFPEMRGVLEIRQHRRFLKTRFVPARDEPAVEPLWGFIPKPKIQNHLLLNGELAADAILTRACDDDVRRAIG